MIDFAAPWMTQGLLKPSTLHSSVEVCARETLSSFCCNSSMSACNRPHLVIFMYNRVPVLEIHLEHHPKAEVAFTSDMMLTQLFVVPEKK